MNPSKQQKIYIIAGEASGDIIGSNLITSLKKNAGHLKFRGIGGHLMSEAGCELVFNYNGLALIGFLEVIPSIFKIIKKINHTVADILLYNPDIIITIDSPGFNFRVVQKLRDRLYTKPIVHYVAPTVWAYHSHRVEIVNKLYDHILVLFPFETKYFSSLPCTFVGHPLIENLSSASQKKQAEDSNHQNSLIKVAIMPGSREGEIKRHMPIILRAITTLQRRFKEEQRPQDKKTLHWYFLCHPNTSCLVKSILFEYMNSSLLSYDNSLDDHNTFVIHDEKLKTTIISSSTVGLIKAGTSVLEAALLKLPMIAFYKINPISAWFLKRKLKIPYLVLCNILLNRRIVPELIQDNFNEKNLIFWLERLITNEEIRKEQLIGFNELTQGKYIGQDLTQKPSQIAAHVILNLLLSTPNIS